MVVALWIIVGGILALLFYVVHVVKPKRVKVSARVWKLAEVNLEADGESRELGKPPGEIAPPESPPAAARNEQTALPESERKALP